MSLAFGDSVDVGQQLYRLPFYYAKKHGVILVSQEGGHLVYFHTFPKPQVCGELLRKTRSEISYVQISETDFAEKLSSFYQNDSSEMLQDAADLGDKMDLNSLADVVPKAEDLLEHSDDAPVIRLINAMIAEAVKENASDIHLETFEATLVVRVRVDGVLREILELQRKLAALLVSRIKVMAKLDIAEKRIPQDGRISLKVAGKEFDIRVSTLPSTNGERVVLRLLNKALDKLTLDYLGLSEDQKQTLNQLIHKPHGIVLVTGPTGSGKTTTLYAGLRTLNDSLRNILTIEDPVEYKLNGIGQTQVNAKVDMTFARGLRAILRQDPDIVMVGEIRDKETADIAVQASLTGHLVLSTLHTNTAVGAITRLQDMGIESFLLSSSLMGVVAQRLVRTLCNECKQPYEMTEDESQVLGITHDTYQVYRANGCSACSSSGYRGRTGLYEILSVDENIRRMIHGRVSEQEVLNGFRKKAAGLIDDGVRKILAGETTIEEVLRVTRKEE